LRPGYRQFCAIARTLDLVGQRWTLLVVRELSLRGALTAGAIARGLPDVPMSQLVQRLAELEAAELVAVGDDGAYRLTGAGLALEPLLGELARFGLDRLPDAGAVPGEPVVPHVLMRQLELRYDAACLRGEGVGGRFELALSDPETLWSVEPGVPAPGRFALIASPEGLSARAGACLHPDAVLRMPVAGCCALVAGRRPDAIAVEGDRQAAEALVAALAPADALAAAA
jgi:DNA-binding HxlR family transcriptional regulator